MGKILEILQGLEATPDHPPGYSPRPKPGPYPYGMSYMGEEEVPYNPQRDAHMEGVRHPKNNFGLPQEQEPVVEEILVRNMASTDTPINGQTLPESQEKWQYLEERLRAIEGASKYRFEVVDLCLIPDVVIPHKFKVPDFDKYKGNSCPKNQLISYCHKMAAHT
ncbi:hypothetical protein CR513_45012, partial [Mucuna pruriens]